MYHHPLKRNHTQKKLLPNKFFGGEAASNKTFNIQRYLEVLIKLSD